MKILVLLSLCYILIMSFSSFSQSHVSVAEINGANLEYIEIGEGEFNIVIESGVGMGVNYWELRLHCS